MKRTLKDSLHWARRQAKAKFDAEILKFMTDHPDESYRALAAWFGVHRNYVGKIGRRILGPRKRGRKPQGASRG